MLILKMEVQMKELVMKVPNISCHHCAHTIKMELNSLIGIKSTEVDVPLKVVTIHFDEPASEEGIRKLLVEINYPAEI
jgi:copper chaperone